MTEDERRALCVRCTLDGVPAVVAGWKNSFATVQQTERPYAAHQWAWGTVARIVAKGGRFGT